jgi:hypothetical protein
VSTEDSAISSLSDALIEALIALCVDGQRSPYHVPYAIDGDCWLRRKVLDRREAINTIKNAVTAVSRPSVDL